MNDLKIGMKFNKLTCLSITDKKTDNHQVYLFLCECGREKELPYSYVKRGRSKSCGCLLGEVSDYTVRGTVLYRTWCDMKQRCFNPNNPAWKYYGGRGITVCDEWKNSFLTFAKDMGERPEGLSIDRKDNNLNYCKDNCKWSSKKEQMNNRGPYRGRNLR